MKRILLILPVLFSFSMFAGAQEVWKYKREIVFPSADTAWARPFICTMDASGNLWLITTKSIDTAVHNALFKVAPGKDTLKKVYDFRTSDLDANSGYGLSGLAAIGNSILVFARVNASPGAGYGFYFPDGDPAKKIGIGAGGYGTHMYGSGATRDSFVYSGISAWGNSIRVHNFSSDASQSAWSAWVPFNASSFSPPFEGQVPTDPGGPTLDGGLIRDLSVLPKGNYNDTNTVFYTSRNSDISKPSGGVAVWKGGTQKKTIVNPQQYRAVRVIDFFADLTWAANTPNGITVDTLGRLWACGTDSTRRWVRVYSVDLSGNPALATMEFELPGKNSPTPDAAGADIKGPADVAVFGATAYVTDLWTRKVYVFQKSTTGVTRVANAPTVFALHQNYPNPFNPSTLIGYELTHSGMVTLKVFNLLGQHVATLVNSVQEPGRHSVTFNAGPLSSGLYVYQLQTNGVTIAKKMLLTR
ncbi:MAG: T9SS type A sorting domain-containing protein [Ignavibacteriales bacterium]|nr:T9SS type A sorting domain-containing protein [Ignavibacteriales bacterium]